MPLIAMTREMGSLGKDVAAGIAQPLRRKVVYHEIIDQLADKMRLRKSHVERFLDGRAGFWERMTTDQTSLSIFTADETFRIMRSGNAAVIRGWGTAHLLRGIPHVIRVRVCAPHETKVERMMERLATDKREAIENELEMSEEAHSAITRRHFGIDWREAEHYDLVLCTERLSVDECVDEILCAMKQKRFQETSQSMRMVENLSLQWSVRAALRCSARTTPLNVAVECDNGRTTLRGVVDTHEQAVAAGEVASLVTGVTALTNELRSTRNAASRYLREA
jgi:cytidylate kinase